MLKQVSKIFFLGFMFFSLSTGQAKDLCIHNNSISQDSALTFYEKGYQQYRKGHFENSEKNLLEALKLEPNLIKAHYWLGKLYKEQGRLKDAIFHWEEVSRLNRLIKFRRQALSFQNNEYPATLQSIKATNDQKSAEKLYEEALHFLDKGHWDGAEIKLREAIIKFPANKDFLRRLARLLWDRNEKQASAKFYRDLLIQKDVSFSDFLEGIDKIFETDMNFLACKLFTKQENRFGARPEFISRRKKLEKEEKLEIVSAGRVIKRLNGQVVLNMGFSQGLNLSDEYSLNLRSFNAGKPILDPVTGKQLGRNADQISADLLITKVFKYSSWALIKREFGPGVKAGDLIEIKETIR